MTLLWLEGFDHYGASITELTKDDGYTYIPNFSIASNQLSCGAWGSLNFYLPSTETTVVFGTRVYIPSGNLSHFLQIVTPGGSRHVSVTQDGIGNLSLVDSTGTVKDTTTGFGTGVWNYVELKLVVGTSAEVRVNGQTVLSDATGDYQSGSDNIGGVKFYTSLNSIWYADHFYIATEYLGQITVQTYYPEVDGTHTDFDPSTGSDHYEMVNEATPSDSDYNESSAPGAKDSYTSTPSLAGPVIGLRVQNRVWKTGGLAAKVKNLVRVGGTDYLGSNEQYLDGVENISDIWENNPDTSSPWTIAEAEAIEFGLQITGISTTTTTV